MPPIGRASWIRKITLPPSRQPSPLAEQRNPGTVSLTGREVGAKNRLTLRLNKLTLLPPRLRPQSRPLRPAGTNRRAQLPCPLQRGPSHRSQLPRRPQRPRRSNWRPFRRQSRSSRRSWRRPIASIRRPGRLLPKRRCRRSQRQRPQQHLQRRPCLSRCSPLPTRLPPRNRLRPRRLRLRMRSPRRQRRLHHLRRRRLKRPPNRPLR
jgi:hypothetical protein